MFLIIIKNQFKPKKLILYQINPIFLFLAPPAEWQRSFSNASSSVVVKFSFKIFISQKLFDNFFSSLAWGFIRKVPM